MSSFSRQQAAVEGMPATSLDLQKGRHAHSNDPTPPLQSTNEYIGCKEDMERRFHTYPYEANTCRLAYSSVILATFDGP